MSVQRNLQAESFAHPQTADDGSPASAAWVIEPRRAGLKARAQDVWRYRRLLRFFAWKAIEKQYARTKLGWIWLLIRPLFPLFVKTLIFAGVLGVSSGTVPYFLFLVVGTTIWELFAGAVMWGTRSLDLNRGLLTRLYVPRLIMPMSMMSPAFVVFIIHLVVMTGTIAYYRITTGVLYVGPPAGLMWSALATILTFGLALGISLWTAVPAMRARDVRFTLNYVLGFWVFLTPVFYPLSSVPAEWRGWMALNPMAVYCQMFKAGIIVSEHPIPRDVLIAVGVTSVVFFSGLWYFNRAESDAADRV
jgi:lipopolysaccharide transport system permease protein